MTSTRLPGKVLKEVLGRPLLEYLVERLRRVELADEIIVATTLNETDLPIVEICRRLNVFVTRGAEFDVLDRYYQAARQHGADIVVRVTSDCPLIDPQVVDDVIRYFHEHTSECDYVSNTLKLSYPLGMSAEVFPFRLLEAAAREAVDEPEREHVTPFIYLRPTRYRIGQVVCPEDLSGHRWTVDTPEDFELVRRIIEALYPVNPQFGLHDILALLRQHPDWQAINAHIRQKKLGE